MSDLPYLLIKIYEVEDVRRRCAEAEKKHGSRYADFLRGVAAESESSLPRKRSMAKVETFKEYSNAVGETAIYPGGLGSMMAINYCTLGLVGEAGELANKLKKVQRDTSGIISDEQREEMLGEAGDVLWYLDRLVTELGSDLGAVALANIKKLWDRKSRGRLKGSGDNR